MMDEMWGNVMNTNPLSALTDEKLRNRYQIIETDSGLRISESRVMLFDVMEAHDAGDSIYQIAHFKISSTC